MNKILLLLFLTPFPTFASPAFKYQTTCYLESKEEYKQDVCTVVETREKGGALRTRNIFSNRFSLTIKGKFDPQRGYVTWDNYNKFEYKWDYKVGNVPGSTTPHSYVMPGFLVENISWD
jgi:hypothetical protein